MLEIIDRKVIEKIGERPERLSKQDMKYVLKVKDPITGEVLKEHIVDYETYIKYKNHKDYEVEVSPESIKQQEEIEKKQKEYDKKYKEVYEQIKKEMNIDDKMEKSIQRIIETVNDWVDIYDYKEKDTSLKEELEEVIINELKEWKETFKELLKL